MSSNLIFPNQKNVPRHMDRDIDDKIKYGSQEVVTVNVITSQTETSVLTRATRRNIPEDAILGTSFSEDQLYLWY
jgi:hypothetical protein